MKKVKNDKWVTVSDGGKYVIEVDHESVVFRYVVKNAHEGVRVGSSTKWRECIQMIEEAQTKDALAWQAFQEKVRSETKRCGCDVDHAEKVHLIFVRGEEITNERLYGCRDCAIAYYRKKLDGIDRNLAWQMPKGASATRLRNYTKRLRELGVQV